MSNDLMSDSIASQWDAQLANESLENSISLDILCSACFGDGCPAEFAVICFDACMQQKALGQGIYNRTDEERDRRLFVDKKIDDKESEEV